MVTAKPELRCDAERVRVGVWMWNFHGQEQRRCGAGAEGGQRCWVWLRKI